MGTQDLDADVVHTADVAAIATVEGRDYLLAVRRAWPPYAGYWALPGGHVDAGETTEHAAVRELAEETGLSLEPSALVPVGVYDTPGRDPRGPYVSTAYTAQWHHTPSVTAADDAADARWLWVDRWELPPLAFDHGRIVADAHHALAAARGGRTKGR